MTIGMTSYAYRWSIGAEGYAAPDPLTPLDVVRRAAAHGFGSVQLCDHLDLRLGCEEVRVLRAAAEDVGVSLEIGLSSSEPDYLRSMLSLAEELGAGLVRIVPEIHRRDRYENVEAQIDAQAARIREAARSDLPDGIVIALENHAGLIASELLSLVQRVDSPHVGVCLDTMNSVALLERPEETAEILAPFTRTVHLKDFSVVRSPMRHAIKGAVLGEGIAPLDRILKLLRRSAPQPGYHIELYLDHEDAEADVLAWEDRMLARSLTYAVERLGFKRTNEGDT